jgi:ComF family protein
MPGEAGPGLVVGLPGTRKARLLFHPAIDPQLRHPSLLQELIGSLCAVVFPADCPVCGQELTEAGGVPICQNCWDSIEPWTGPACARCGLPFATSYASDANLCAECRLEEHEFDLARSYGLYLGTLRRAILLLKFQRRERLGQRLGMLLEPVWESVEELRTGEDLLLVPVPLHPSRRRERGFNQAELLALGLSRKLAKAGERRALRVETCCLRRIRATPPQTGLSLRARRENVRGVFAVDRPAMVRDRVVVLVDDVMTTGATLSACAAALKQAGAARVVALALARATPQFPDQASDLSRLPVDEFGRERT